MKSKLTNMQTCRKRHWKPLLEVAASWCVDAFNPSRLIQNFFWRSFCSDSFEMCTNLKVTSTLSNLQLFLQQKPQCQKQILFKKTNKKEEKNLWLSQNAKKVQVVWILHSGLEPVVMNYEQVSRVCSQWSCVEKSFEANRFLVTGVC